MSESRQPYKVSPPGDDTALGATGASAEDEREAIETFLRERFEENYELLRLESGQALAPDVRETAFQQVLLYWRKLSGVARAVSETEVRLTLPAQTTPGGRTYTIEGIVDIVREDDRTVMYDIKTHHADDVRAAPEFYEKQLNVYAHIWQNLRGQPLDHTAVIATGFTHELKGALRDGPPEAVDYHLERWDPIVPIPFDDLRVEETIGDFASTVDAIEDGRFEPPPPEALSDRGRGQARFASRVCINCDARFSCDSYRTYALGPEGSRSEAIFKDFFADPDADRENRLAAGLDDESP